MYSILINILIYYQLKNKFIKNKQSHILHIYTSQILMVLSTWNCPLSCPDALVGLLGVAPTVPEVLPLLNNSSSHENIQSWTHFLQQPTLMKIEVNEQQDDCLSITDAPNLQITNLELKNFVTSWRLHSFSDQYRCLSTSIQWHKRSFWNNTHWTAVVVQFLLQLLSSPVTIWNWRRDCAAFFFCLTTW